MPPTLGAWLDISKLDLRNIINLERRCGGLPSSMRQKLVMLLLTHKSLYTQATHWYDDTGTSWSFIYTATSSNSSRCWPFFITDMCDQEVIHCGWYEVVRTTTIKTRQKNSLIRWNTCCGIGHHAYGYMDSLDFKSHAIEEEWGEVKRIVMRLRLVVSFCRRSCVTLTFIIAVLCQSIVYGQWSQYVCGCVTCDCDCEWCVEDGVVTKWRRSWLPATQVKENKSMAPVLIHTSTQYTMTQVQLRR